MANEQVLQQLTTAVDKFNKVELDKLLRKGLGDESLDTRFTPQLEEIQRLKEFTVRYAPSVHSNFVSQAHNTINTLADAMTAQANRPSADYIAQREAFLNTVKTQIEDSKIWLPYFTAAAVQERGFLEDEGIRTEYQRAVQNLKSETAATLATVKEEAEKAVQGAKTLAEEIEARARRTATGISVQDAQRQFQEASVDLGKKVKLWGRITAASIALLIVVPLALMLWPLPGPEPWPLAMYHTLLRLFVLSVVSAFTAFCLRILRAHLHMAEKNRHRVRVANSVESFVNSALEPQQRDLLLAKLAEAIVDFGDSGIIKPDRDDQSSAVISGDMLGRILATLSSRKV